MTKGRRNDDRTWFSGPSFPRKRESIIVSCRCLVFHFPSGSPMLSGGCRPLRKPRRKMHTSTIPTAKPPDCGAVTCDKKGKRIQFWWKSEYHRQRKESRINSGNAKCVILAQKWRAVPALRPGHGTQVAPVPNGFAGVLIAPNSIQGDPDDVCRPESVR